MRTEEEDRLDIGIDSEGSVGVDGDAAKGLEECWCCEEDPARCPDTYEVGPALRRALLPRYAQTHATVREQASSDGQASEDVEGTAS